MPKRVLFLCTGNSCRSQMAEGFLRARGRGAFEVFSAGMKPTAVNPLAIRVMKERGVDISGHRSKSVQEYLGKHFDAVITVCDNAQQICPVFSGTYEKIHWNLEDPAAAGGTEEERILVFRTVRDKIDGLVGDFIKRSPNS